MNVKDYIKDYMDIVTSTSGVRYVIAKGTHLFHYIPINDFLCDDLATFLAKHEITTFGSMWNSDDAEYIPIDFGYSLKEHKWYTWHLGNHKTFDTKEEVMEWYNDLYQSYLHKNKHYGNGRNDKISCETN